MTDKARLPQTEIEIALPKCDHGDIIRWLNQMADNKPVELPGDDDELSVAIRRLHGVSD